MIATETLEQIMHRVRRQRASLIVTEQLGFIGICPVDTLPEEDQRLLWKSPGEFWIAGAPLEVHEAWHVTHWPDDYRARALSALLLVQVAAYVSRPPSRRRHPPPAIKTSWPGVTWH